MNREFVDKHCNFRLGQKDIGYGLRPEHVLEVRAANAKDPTDSKPSTSTSSPIGSASTAGEDR